MASNDELDRSRAGRFAWRITMPELAEEERAKGDEPLDDDLVGAEDHEEKDGGGLDDDWRVKAREACGLLADGVARVWAMADLARQAEATAELVRRAAEIGLGAVGMQDHPLESIRLLRLVARHRDRLPPDAVEASRAAAPWLDFSHPEVAELVLDQARAGDRSMELSMMLAFGSGDDREAMPQPPSFGARLGEIIDGGSTWSARTCAIRAVRYADGAAFVPALLRALRVPHAVTRWIALNALERSFPGAVREEDVLFLLEDAVLHPLPTSLDGLEDVSRALAYYPDLVGKAAARVRPCGGARPLERIIAHECPDQGLRWSLDASWALDVLALAYPDRAEVLIDHHLTDSFTRARASAARAAGSLPPERARPRLLRAAGDGAPDVSEPAREHWIRLFGASCPEDELSPFAHLLDAAPSDRLRARVLGLRGPAEARHKLASVLLAEAPDLEALVALLIALSDRDAFSSVKLAGVPDDCKGWITAIVAGFGSRGIDGLCALAARHESEVSFGWFQDLADMLDKHALSDDDLAKLRAVAVARVASRAFGASSAALGILIKVGSPPELYHRLWELVWDTNESWIIAYKASSVLARWADPARLEADVLGAMRAGLAAGDHEKVLRAAEVGLQKPMTDAIPLAREAFDALTTRTHLDEPLTQALCFRAQELVRAGGLPAGWLYEALASLETCRFTVAAELVPHDIALEKAPPEAKTRLLRALDSNARNGVAAAEAAVALLKADAIGVRNPRLVAVFARAPHPVRAALLGEFLFRAVPLARAWPAVEDLFTTTDPVALATLRDDASQLPWRGHRKRLLALYPRLVDPELRETFGRYLDAVRDEPGYWEDSENDE
jgi:hypothetical protein